MSVGRVDALFNEIQYKYIVAVRLCRRLTLRARFTRKRWLIAAIVVVTHE